MTAPPIEYLQRVAGLHLAEEWDSGQWPRLLVFAPNGGCIRLGVGDDHAHWMSARYVVMNRASDYVVYHSGLVLPAPLVPGFWEYKDEIRQGNAEQAVEYARRRRLDSDTIWPVDPSRVHGTYVRFDGERPDGRDYRLVHARAFPTWAGV